MGNPGTGKTTVARCLADKLYSIGTLSSNRLVVVEKKDLIGKYVGETTKLTEKVVDKARGGVLFIDEAYSLVPSQDSSATGKEAIEVLLTAMEKYKEDTIFIFAGYPREMWQFIESNPGIRSRIGYTFLFEDYSVDELMEIFVHNITDEGFVIDEDAKSEVRKILEYFHSVPNFGNGRFVEHVVNQIINKRAGRDYEDNGTDITLVDIPEVGEIIRTAPDGLNLYDPALITEEEKYRTAVHETGHGLLLYLLDPENLPEKISVSSEAGSFGRVEPGNKQKGNYTETDLLNRIAVLLGGRNAERVILGDHSTGCSEDFERAKELASRMVEIYAMGEIGETKSIDFLKKGDAKGKELLEKYQDFIRFFAKELQKKEVVSGIEFDEMFRNFYAD